MLTWFMMSENPFEIAFIANYPAHIKIQVAFLQICATLANTNTHTIAMSMLTSLKVCVVVYLLVPNVYLLSYGLNMQLYAK